MKEAAAKKRGSLCPFWILSLTGENRKDMMILKYPVFQEPKANA